MAERDRVIRGYALALFAVAEAEGSQEEIEGQLYQFARTVEREGGLREALLDPRLPADRKRAVLEALLGGRANPHAVALLSFVIDQGRAKDLPRIIEALIQEAAERRRRAVAEVRTAVPLDEEHRRRLAEALGRATGKDVELHVVVDPAVIGGVVARVGDQVFDGSIRRKLELAREQLVQVG